MAEQVTRLYAKLKPLFVRDFGGGRGRGVGGGLLPGNAELLEHDLDGPLHTGLLAWGRVNKVGSSLGDLGNRAHSLLTGRNNDDHSQYVHVSTARTITARHVFNPGTPASPFLVGANGNGRLVSGLNADLLDGLHEDIFMRKSANSNLQMNGFQILSNETDQWHGLGHMRIGNVGFTGWAGLRHREISTSSHYMAMQNASGRTLVNAATGQNIGLRINNVNKAILNTSSLAFYTPVALHSDNYASQLTGWRITYDGQGDFRYLYADELHAKVFIADLEQALAGGQIITKSVSILSRNFTAPAAGGTATLYVWDLPSAENMAVFQSGDIVRLRTFSRSGGSLTIADCWGVVTSYSNLADKEQSWTFTRSSGGNAGAMSAGTVVQADSIVLDYGTSGNGFHEVNAIDGLYGANSPYSQIATWSGHPATGQTIRTRMGNLAGVGFTGEYGLYARGADANQYLKLSGAGALLRNIDLHMHNGSARTVQINSADGAVRLGSDVASDLTMALRSWSDGRIRIGPTGTDAANLYWSGTSLQLRQNTTPVIRLDGDGSSYFAGVMTIGTSGEIRQGTGTVGSNFSGLRLRNISSMGRISLWNNNSEDVIFDGNGIDLQGQGTTTGAFTREINWWDDISSRTGDPIATVTTFTDGIFLARSLLLRAKGTTGTYSHGQIFLSVTNHNNTSSNYLTVHSDGNVAIGGKLALDSNSPTLGSNWANRGGGEQNFAVRRFGNLVEIVGLIDASGSPATTIATLPSEFRPTTRRFGATPVFISSGSQNVVRRIDINTNGTVQASGWTPASGDSILFGIMYYL